MRQAIAAFITTLAVAVAVTSTASAQEPRRGGTLVMGQSTGTTSFNNAVGSGTGIMVPGAQIFASPVMHDDKWSPKPYLAESWELSPDSLSMTLHLRKDALFHDGTPVTSADVALTPATARFALSVSPNPSSSGGGLRIVFDVPFHA